jgi:hypothetical protein
MRDTRGTRDLDVVNSLSVQLSESRLLEYYKHRKISEIKIQIGTHTNKFIYKYIPSVIIDILLDKSFHFS